MAQVSEVLVPDIGDFSDVPVIEVLVKPGDVVAVESPLITLESDKATMDVPSPVAGVVGAIRIAVGDVVSKGTPILTISTAGDGDIAAPAAPRAASAPASGAAEPASPQPAVATEPLAAPAPSAPDAVVADGPIYASPHVRRLARAAGIDLRAVIGTGRNGRITPADVDAALAAPAGRQAPSAAAGGLQVASWPSIDHAKFGPVERQPLSRIARIAGPALHRNWVTIPHVTQFDEADITDLETFRKRTNEEVAGQGVKLTMVALVMKACVATLKAFPRLNASLDGDELVVKGYYHLGFAADTPNGLLVPVIRDVDRKGILDIARELAELSGKARAGTISPTEMAGGTFTISSLGGIGGTAFTPIVNAPEVAILGVSRSVMKPVWDGAEFRPRLMLPLSLSYDHRVIDGAEGARVTTHLAGVLSDLRKALL